MLACLSGLGAFEYFQLAEELNAEPVWVINNGISHTYSVPADQIWPLVQVLGTIPSLSTDQPASKHVETCFIIHPWTAALLSSIMDLLYACVFGAPPDAFVRVLLAPLIALCYPSSRSRIARGQTFSGLRVIGVSLGKGRAGNCSPRPLCAPTCSFSAISLSAYYMSCVVYINWLRWVYNCCHDLM